MAQIRTDIYVDIVFNLRAFIITVLAVLVLKTVAHL